MNHERRSRIARRVRTQLQLVFAANCLLSCQDENIESKSVNILLLRCNYELSCVMPVVTNAAVIRSAEVSFASRPARPHLLATR